MSNVGKSELVSGCVSTDEYIGMLLNESPDVSSVRVKSLMYKD